MYEILIKFKKNKKNIVTSMRPLFSVWLREEALKFLNSIFKKERRNQLQGETDELN